MTIRPRVYAEGHAPCIEISSLPEGAGVFIGGNQAWRNNAGASEAPGWNEPGQHLVDVVPGPSLTYEIVPDPARTEGWSFWNAHEQRFLGSGPWARARICGAAVSGPAGEIILAHEARPVLIALGSRDHATALQQRTDVNVSVGLLPAAPAFLIASSGQRRHQGAVVWIGLEVTPSSASNSTRSVLTWANIVRNAASRRLPLEAGGSSLATDAWRKATRRARSLRRRLA